MQTHQTYGMLIKRISDTFEKTANNTLREQDLTMTQAVALGKLNRTYEKQASLKELESILHVAQSTTAGIIARLEQKGLVETFGAVSDKRIKNVKLTSLGEQFCQAAEQHMVDNETKLLAGLTETEQSIFYSLLMKVNDTIR
ncbi:MAG: MarR family transcriptional regulator [Clostridiales bacterium]|nr:MarR family transcriptional regulator [Clostridiales bacterium]